MGSVVKIVIGSIIGALVGVLGTWLVLNKEAPSETTEKATQAEELDKPKAGIVSKDMDIERAAGVGVEEKGAPAIQKLQADLLRVEQQLKVERQAKQAALSKLNKVANGGVLPSNENSQQSNEYLEDIPEDYHQLLDPPERRKDLPELHRDLVEEEQDLNWGLGMGQQIKSFVMNHPHSNYLLDFRVTCKTTMCEMMSKIPVEHTKKWSDLCNDMRKEGWWEFSGTSSSGTYTEDKKNYVNIRLMTREKGSKPDNAEN